MNSTYNNINFKAKLNTSELKGNPERWKKIAKEFQAQTKKYPSDEFSLSSEGYSSYWIWFARTKNGEQVRHSDWSCMKRSLFEELEQLSDSELVNKLKRLFNIQRNIDNMEKDTVDFFYKYGLDKSNVPGKAETNLYSAMFDAQEALIERHLKNDKFLYANREHIDFNT